MLMRPHCQQLESIFLLLSGRLSTIDWIPVAGLSSISFSSGELADFSPKCLQPLLDFHEIFWQISGSPHTFSKHSLPIHLLGKPRPQVFAHPPLAAPNLSLEMVFLLCNKCMNTRRRASHPENIYLIEPQVIHPRQLCLLDFFMSFTTIDTSQPPWSESARGGGYFHGGKK